MWYNTRQETNFNLKRSIKNEINQPNNFIEEREFIRVDDAGQ